MQLLNRDSRKTPVAQPFLAVDPCHGSGFKLGRKALATNRTSVVFLRSLPPLLSIFGVGLLVGIGPVVLNTIAHASFLSIQIFLRLCQLGLTICQIFGM
jgi:hypothetical protein